MVRRKFGQRKAPATTGVIGSCRHRRHDGQCGCGCRRACRCGCRDCCASLLLHRTTSCTPALAVRQAVAAEFREAELDYCDTRMLRRLRYRVNPATSQRANPSPVTRHQYPSTAARHSGRAWMAARDGCSDAAGVARDLRDGLVQQRNCTLGERIVNAGLRP